MIDEKKFMQYGFPRQVEDIKCIILHNTGNTKMSANDIFYYLNKECKTNQGCTYVVDHNEVVQILPDDYAVYNTGKGIDYACKYGIAIEVCDNLNDELYMKGQDKAVELIKELMEKYDIPKEEIYFHIDFAPTKRCPHIMLDKYGSAKRFVIEEIESEE